MPALSVPAYYGRYNFFAENINGWVCVSLVLLGFYILSSFGYGGLKQKIIDFLFKYEEPKEAENEQKPDIKEDDNIEADSRFRM